MTRLICIQTYHGHWAGPSGYHNYLPHLRERFHLDHRRIERGKVVAEDIQGTERLWFRPLIHLSKKFTNPWSTERDLLEEFRLVGEVKRYLARGEKVVVHFMDGEVGFCFFGAYLPLIGRDRSRLRLLATYHQPPTYLKKVLPRIKRAEKLDRVLTVGTSQFKSFDFLPQSKLRFVHHGVDTEYFQPGGPPPRGKSKLFCITVGQWLRDFDALEEVIRSAPKNLVFRFVAVKESLNRFRGLPNVELFSGIDDDALLQLYRESHIGLMPLQDATANNALLEMMACGKPVIVSRVGSIGDYVTDNCCSLLRSNEPKDILANLRRLEQNVEERGRLGQAARQKALEFSWPRIADRMAAVYHQSFNPAGLGQQNGEDKQP